MSRVIAAARSGVRAAALASGLAVAMGLAGCSSLTEAGGFYWQAVSGHLDMMRRARPIDSVLADPTTDAALRARLELSREMRAFASRELALPDNGSFTTYADLKRPYVLWNVFATDELSVKLRQWCFPIAGCIGYRGYYALDAARSYAGTLRASGLDVQVGGVPAYSTLGWFDDPLLSTFIRFPEGEVARLIFHELAHQVVYVKGDTTFNESFASAVEEVGMDRWFANRADDEGRRRYQAHRERRAAFTALLLDHKRQLETLYAQPIDDAAKRRGKQAVFESLRAGYEQLKLQWNGFAGYDRWFDEPLTNAHLAAVGAYADLLPAFRALLNETGGQMPAFYSAVRELAALPPQSRQERMKVLSDRP